MPQLDLMTFFTQFFWFSLGFSFFYISLLHYIMPSISVNLKLRKKKLDLLAIDINKKKESASNLLTTYDNILLSTLNFSRNYLLKFTNYGSNWISNSANDVNLNDFVNANNTYVKIIGEKNFNLIVLESTLKSSIKDSYWTKLWISK